MGGNKILLISLALLIFIFSPGMAQTSLSVIRFAGLQMNTEQDIRSNKERIIKGLEEAARNHADFLVTPEGSLSGYTDQFNQGEVQTALDEILSIAKKLKVGLFLGTCYQEQENSQTYCYNQVRVYDQQGMLMGVYSKILRCSPLDKPGTGEMAAYVEGHLQLFEWKGIKIGTLICNDLWASPGYTTIPNPYLAWKLRQMGAQMIVHCINSGYDQRYRKFHESSAELWALSLHIPILEVNAAQGANVINAGSGLIDGQGNRKNPVPDSGDQFFVKDVEVAEAP